MGQPHLSSVSPLRDSPPHALDVRPVGGMIATPAAATTRSNNRACSLNTILTATTDSKGYSTVASYSPGDVPFVTTPEPFLNTWDYSGWPRGTSNQRGITWLKMPRHTVGTPCPRQTTCLIPVCALFFSPGGALQPSPCGDTNRSASPASTSSGSLEQSEKSERELASVLQEVTDD